jgi:hypothetical protein
MNADPLLLQTLRDLRRSIDANTSEQAKTNAALAALGARVETLEQQQHERREPVPPPSPWRAAVAGALASALVMPVLYGLAGWVLASRPATPTATIEPVSAASRR